MIRGITFSEQVFYSADFAHYMNFFLNGGVGITKGCSITNDGTKVTIGTGYFVAHGRLMNVETAETIEATQGFEPGYNRIVYEIDLSRENTILDFRQGAIRVLQTEALTQEDLDAGGLIYQFPLCHFQWSGAAITGFVVDAPTLVLDDIMKQWSDNYTAINAQFDVWFAQQKSTIEGMVADLQRASGSVLGSIFFTDKVLAVADFVADTTYTEYPYRAEIIVNGITSDFVTDVNFAPADADSGIFATVTKTEADKITVYAKEIPESDITIPTIECRTGNYNTTGSIDLNNYEVATDDEITDAINKVYSSN